MIKVYEINDWYNLQDIPIIDVRSPGEFAQAHVMGAHNVPLFNDQERAEVGTLYKQHGKEPAMQKGLELVGPKMVHIYTASKELAKEQGLRIHCWRGGMRSSSVAWLLQTMGVPDVYTLAGGYKAYRKWILDTFEQNYPMRIIGGRTGSAKTDILKYLQSNKEAIIDLEQLACHKGSAFGWIGESAQPSQEQFENHIGESLYKHQGCPRLWLEDESENIGRLRIPHSMFKNIRAATVFFLDIPKKIRINHLINTYTQYGDDKLEQSILKIQKKLGGLNTQQALQSLAKKDYESVTDLLLTYYDKTYETGINKRSPASVIKVVSDTIDPEYNARLILSQLHKIC